jgi:hypothetical protein
MSSSVGSAAATAAGSTWNAGSGTVAVAAPSAAGAAVFAVRGVRVRGAAGFAGASPASDFKVRFAMSVGLPEKNEVMSSDAGCDKNVRFNSRAAGMSAQVAKTSPSTETTANRWKIAGPPR